MQITAPIAARNRERAQRAANLPPLPVRIIISLASRTVFWMPLAPLGWLSCPIRLEIGASRLAKDFVKSSANSKGVMFSSRKMPASIPAKASRISTIKRFPPSHRLYPSAHRRSAPAGGAASHSPAAAFAGLPRSWTPFEIHRALLSCRPPRRYKVNLNLTSTKFIFHKKI